jgi:hypothetical protein
MKDLLCFTYKENFLSGIMGKEDYYDLQLFRSYSIRAVPTGYAQYYSTAGNAGCVSHDNYDEIDIAAAKPPGPQCFQTGTIRGNRQKPPHKPPIAANR